MGFTFVFSLLSCRQVFAGIGGRGGGGGEGEGRGEGGGEGGRGRRGKGGRGGEEEPYDRTYYHTSKSKN